MSTVMLSKKNIQDYLAQVAIKQSPEVSIHFMKKLQAAHVGTFCFSNLGVLLHEDLSLESQALFERVVTRKRGGYCFEQNKIVYEILQYCGFSCEIALARVLHNRHVDVPRTHRITKVTIDANTYIVDVGFGPLVPREPLLLDCDEPQDQGDSIYRIVRARSGHYLLQKEEVDGWFTLYSFDDAMYTEADCVCGHHYSSTHPEAAFVNNLVISKKSYDDVQLLRNAQFHRIQGGRTAVTEISSKDHLGAILAQEFGIDLMPEQLSALFKSYCK